MVPSLTNLLSHNNFFSCAEMILDSVSKCDVDVRRDLYSGIILTGTSISPDSLLPLASSLRNCNLC